MFGSERIIGIKGDEPIGGVVKSVLAVDELSIDQKEKAIRIV